MLVLMLLRYIRSADVVDGILEDNIAALHDKLVCELLRDEQGDVLGGEGDGESGKQGKTVHPKSVWNEHLERQA